MKKPCQLKIQVHSSSSSEQPSPSLNSDGQEYFDYFEVLSQNNIIYAEVSAKRCGRQKMEDRFQAIADFDGKQQQFYFAVFDGHGGSYVAKTLQEQLHCVIKNNRFFNSDLEQAIQESFMQMNIDILNKQKTLMKDGGSTALCIINQGKEIFIINVGDSIGVLIDQKFQIKKLNSEHKPDRIDESERILQHNGYVLMIKNQARINGELAVSRSFGDLKYIENGLTAVPEITKININEDAKYIILATDGFWDVIAINELPSLICYWEQKQPNEGLSQFLLNTASKTQTNFKKDNMTIIVINLTLYYKNLI